MGYHAADKSIDRRRFLHSAAAAGAGAALAPMVWGQTPGDKADDINVALLGVGEQGQVLMTACLKIPGVRIKAVCDIWEAYNLRRASRILNAYRHDHNTYVDYQEMLDKEKDLDAAIIATPDFRHAEHAVDCLSAGLHVYCEKEMSNTLEGARKMVLAVQKTGKLLQIGHQRRSNPRYVFCYENLIRGAKLLGQTTAVNGQWNRRASEPLGWPKDSPVDQAILEECGYASMEQFRNWRWYKGLGGGPMVDLGSHQIDIYNWFLEAHPKSVIASGRTNFYDPGTHEWPDTVMAVYEYETARGNVTAFYQTVSSSGTGGYFESFMGNQGALIISERNNRCEIYRDERAAPPWDQWVKDGLLYKQCECEIDCIEKAKEECIDKCGCAQITERTTGAVLDVRESPLPPKYDLPVAMNKKPHQIHLENFFDAIYSRGKVALTCPAETGYETAVAVLKVNEAIEAGQRLTFEPEEFKA